MSSKAGSDTRGPNACALKGTLQGPAGASFLSGKAIEGSRIKKNVIQDKHEERYECRQPHPHPSRLGMFCPQCG